ncbi:MAG: hypothetical protein FH751_13705 [Firmicutes bacterium]|nr:hypothetical protein [Bacillota bacterium]
MYTKKNEIARKYYADLISLKSIDNNVCKKIYAKTKKIGKDEFINNYPISTLGIINYRTFWEICMELEIVNHPYYYDRNKYSPFELKLHNILSSLINDGKNSKYCHDDIKNLLNKVKICA